MNSIKNIILIMICLLSCTDCLAQDNPYKIKENLYEYYLKLASDIQSDKALNMADTLFEMAKNEKDLKAQCLALYMRQRHYYFEGDVGGCVKEFHMASPFILKTPYLQYYFGMWINIITKYINNDDYSKVSSEILSLRRKAIYMKSDYGIYQSYVLQANIYTHLNHFKLALAYYRLAYDYAKSKNMADFVDLYIHIARNSFYLGRWDECKRNLDLAFGSSLDINRTKLYALYVSYYCCQIPIDSAKVETNYKLFTAYNKKYPLSVGDYFLSNETKYYYYKYYKKDDDQTKAFANDHYTIPDYIDYIKKASYYDSINNYKEACRYYDLYIRSIMDFNASEEKYLVDDFLPKLDNYNLEHEKSELRKNNELLTFKDLNNKQSILKLTEQQAEMKLITKKGESDILTNRLAMQEALIQQQNRLLKIKQLQNEHQKKVASIVKGKEKWRFSFVFIFLVSLFSFVIFYAIDKSKKRKLLKAETDKAEKSNYIKSLFFQNMSHELRTPLNAISGFNDILNGEMSSTLSSAEKKEFISMITVNSDLLMTLVNDVIDLSNFETGTYNLHFSDVSINSICKTAVESIRGRQNEEVDLSFKPTRGDDFKLHTDAQRLQQVLTNYLTNACKHTDKGSIVLSYDVDMELVRFSVTDTGSGVKNEDAEKIFERFSMLDRNKQGTGLGLHICRIIANLLKGRVYLDTSYHNGARFIFDHPVVKGLLFFLIMTFFPCHISAANVTIKQANKEHVNYAERGKKQIKSNEFGINDKLYAIYKQAEKEFCTPQGLELAEKMYDMSVRMGDVKAQCIALYVQSYYSVRLNKTMFITKSSECKRLCISSGNYQCAYDNWVEIVGYYVEQRNFNIAMKELGEMYQLAKKHNDQYGLGAYYFSAGNYYLMQYQYAAALFYYIHSLDYKTDNLSSIYSMIGQCYYRIRDYNKAVIYLEKSLNISSGEEYAAYPLLMLERCYRNLNMPDKAKSVYARLLKLNQDRLRTDLKSLLHEALFYYYSFIEKNDDKAAEEEKLSNEGNIDNYTWAKFYFDKGYYEKALAKYKSVAKVENSWMLKDYKDVNNFYIDKYVFRESAREKDLLEISAMSLKVKEARNSHELLRLKHDNTIWLLRQNELFSKDKEGKLELQKVLLDKKESEYQKQYITALGLKQQNEMLKERMRWKTLTILVIAFFVILCVVIYFLRMQKYEKKLKLDAIKVKQTEKKKNLFFDSINRQINKPINTIININHKLNDDNYPISDSERKADVEELNKNTLYLTEYINDVLIISKIESGTYEKRNDSCDINAICLQQLSAVGQPGMVEYKPIPSDGTRNVIISDSVMIERAVSSFIQFALKNNDGVNPVILASDVNSSKLTVSVSLSNRFDEKYVSSMFEFGTDDNRDNIGLYKVKLIADMLGGAAYTDSSSGKCIKLVFEISVLKDGK